MQARVGLLFAVAAACATPISAGESCHRCGCCQDVVAVCRPSCGTKEVTETCYTVVCEDFCVPGCSHARRCETACGECQTVWEPSCGRVRTRQKLVKTEIKKKVPVTTCTVVYLCPRCCQECGCAPGEEGWGVMPAAPSTPLPPPPVPQAAYLPLAPTEPATAPPVKPRSIWTALGLSSVLRR